MSKEEYLKGEEKEKILEQIKTYIAFRLTNEEILYNLKDKGIKICERTLRRFKQELRANPGTDAADIFKNYVLSNLTDDIFSYEKMQRECWKVYCKAQRPQEKLRALSTLRLATLDKIKMLSNIPRGYRKERTASKLKNLQKERKEITGWLQNQTKPKIHS